MLANVILLAIVLLGRRHIAPTVDFPGRPALA